MKKRKINIHIVRKNDQETDLAYWQNKTPEERVEAVEFLRSQYYALAGFKKTPRFIPNIEVRNLHQ